MRRTLIAATLCVAAASSLVACGSSDNSSTGSSGATSGGSTTAAAAPAEQASGKKVAFVGPIVAPVWLDAKNGFFEEAKKQGMDPSWTAPTAVDIPGNVQAVQNAINSGADGVAFCALDPKAYQTALDAAKSKGVPVVLVDCDTADKSLRTAYVGTVGKTFGAKTAQELVSRAGDTGNVIVLQQTLDSQIANDIFDGFKDELATNAPGWKIVTREADQSDIPKTVAQLEGLLRTHPETTYIYCIEANCPSAAATVIKEKGLDGKVHVIGIDDQQPTLDGIRNGVVTFSAAQPFSRMGRLAASAFADHFNGKQPASTTDTGVLVIDRSNVDTYKQEAK